MLVRQAEYESVTAMDRHRWACVERQDRRLKVVSSAKHRGPSRWQHISLLILLVAQISVASRRSFALEDTYLLCKGSISIMTPSGSLTSYDKQQLAVHVMRDRIKFSGNDFLGGEAQICRPSTDEFNFDSESCKGVSDRDLFSSPPRIYGIFNNITAELHLSSEFWFPNGPLNSHGKFMCGKVEPLIR
jgi:hypothetical protein